MEQSANVNEEMLKKMDDVKEDELSDISEIIENSDIEEDDKERIISIIQKEEFRGPLPHPQVLMQYEEIQQGFANEIVQMAVKEQSHRHEMEKALVDSEILLNSGQIEVLRASIMLKSRLQVFGFFSTTVLLVIGAVCIFLDKNVGSISAFILAVGSFCWTMFYGKKSDDEKAKDSDDAK